jgi:hypothetical protein
MDTYYFTTEMHHAGHKVKEYFDEKRQAVRTAIAKEPDERLLMTSLPVYSSSVVALFRQEPLIIQYQQLSVSDVVGELSDSFTLSHSRKIQVVILHLPYLGSAEVLKLVTNPWAKQQQQGVHATVTERELQVRIENTRRDIDWLKSEKRRELDVLAEVVAWCNSSVETYNQNLPALIEPLVTQRITHIQEERRVLKENRQMLDALTEPYVPKVTHSPKDVVSVSATPGEDSQDWDNDE